MMKMNYPALLWAYRTAYFFRSRRNGPNDRQRDIYAIFASVKGIISKIVHRLVKFQLQQLLYGLKEIEKIVEIFR